MKQLDSGICFCNELHEHVGMIFCGGGVVVVAAAAVLDVYVTHLG